MKSTTTPDKFWKLDENGKSIIIQSKFIDFLNESGFAKAEISKTDYVLVQVRDNLVREISDYIIVNYVQDYLKKIDEKDVLEAFSKGVSNYVSKAKLRLLNTEELVNDRDESDLSSFYFENICCQVGNSSITEKEYSEFSGKIWESRLIPHNFMLPLTLQKSQFEVFCHNLSGKDENRFIALKTNIGYLLHRFNNPGNARAVIFLDENISFDGTANGGTGKSLLLQGIGKCRELVVMDGKNLKGKSWFKNQRINRTTDIVFYDDVGKDFSLEELYSMITTGVVVEKKYKSEEYIMPEKSPKLCLSSNYVINGTGGNTDSRRRCEFEVSNHYNETFTPEDEFGNLFFQDWDDAEWNLFYLFMMNCVMEYFKNGLIIVNPINLKQNKLINATSLEFVSFIETEVVELNKWICKKATFELFILEYPHFKNLSPHQFTKWMKEYCRQSNLIYEPRKSGPKYEFYLKTLVDTKDVSEIEIIEEKDVIEVSKLDEEKEVSDEK